MVNFGLKIIIELCPVYCSDPPSVLTVTVDF